MTHPVDQTSTKKKLSASILAIPNGTATQLTNLWRVVLCPKDQLGSSIVPRANVGNVRFVFHQNLSAAEITKLQDTSRRVKQEVLWLDISVADAL
jgi:hypothetical protein